MTTEQPVWVLSTGAATLIDTDDPVLSDYKTYSHRLK